MRKKSVIDEKPAPPDHLSEKAKEIFSFYVQKNKPSPGQIALLILGLEKLDTVDECGQIIRTEGLTVTSERSGITRKHPLIDTQKEATNMFLKISKQLQLGRPVDSFFPETNISDFDFDLNPPDFDV